MLLLYIPEILLANLIGPNSITQPAATLKPGRSHCFIPLISLFLFLSFFYFTYSRSRAQRKTCRISCAYGYTMLYPRAELHVPVRAARVIRCNLLEMLKIIFSTSPLFLSSSLSFFFHRSLLFLAAVRPSGRAHFSVYVTFSLVFSLLLSFIHSPSVDRSRLSLCRRIARINGFVQSTAITYPASAL